MKTFNKQNLLSLELSTIQEWTENSLHIKKTMWGLTKSHVHQANILFGLFDKYNPNINSNVTLYRGMSFTKDEFEYYGYSNINKGDSHTPDPKAIVSFTTHKQQAFEYATLVEGRNYKVFYILNNEKEAFDISSFS